MQQITATRIKIPFATILASALALPVEADVEMSFAGRLEIDSHGFHGDRPRFPLWAIPPNGVCGTSPPPAPAAPTSPAASRTAHCALLLIRPAIPMRRLSSMKSSANDIPS